MKIRAVAVNRRRKTFDVKAGRRVLTYPFAKASPAPTADDPVRRAFVDKELGREAFSFVLASGRDGTVHIDQVLEYNRDPEWVRERLLYNLTLETHRRLAASVLSKREIIRRLGTSASQFYRLVDQTNYRKSIDQMLALLHVLDCEVEVTVRKKSA